MCAMLPSSWALEKSGKTAELATRSLSATEFNRLSETGKRVAVGTAFRRRLEFARDLSYEVEIRVAIHFSNGGTPGDLKETCGVRRCRAWRLEDSFRLESDCYRPGDDHTVAQRCNSGFDAKEGVARSTVIIKNSRVIRNARIDTKPDTIVIEDRYAYWLAGDTPHPEEFLFQDLLEHEDKWQFEAAAGGLVKLVSPFRPWWETRPGGDRVFMLDPEKGLLPVSGESQWHGDTTPDGMPQWRIERFKVDQSREIDGVWMPIILHESLTASSAPKTIAVRETKVAAIEHGRVTEKDLDVRFEEGMTVVDAINAVTYVADAEGKPAGTVEPVYGAGNLRPHVTTDTRASATRRWVILISIGVFGVVAMLISGILRHRST